MLHAQENFAAQQGSQKATNRIEERKARDREARRTQIIRAARRIAESEGWSNVTVRRLSDEISYSQPVLYSHFRNRDGIVTAVAIEGFQELSVALKDARENGRRGSPVERVANAYLKFASTFSALYEAMFSLHLIVPFDESGTPSELRSAFFQVFALFEGRSSQPDVLAELFWASLHGVAELTRARRLPPQRQKERVRVLVERFTV